MAKQPKPNMTYQDLMQLDASELERLAKHYRKLTWQRLDRLKRANLTSQAVDSLENLAKAGRIPAFGTENRKGIKRTKQSAVREILAYDYFMSLKTSTVKGARNFLKVTAERLGVSYENASIEVQRQFWRLYNRKRDEIEQNTLDSDGIQLDLIGSFLEPGYKYITNNRVQELEDFVTNAWKRKNSATSPYDAVTSQKTVQTTKSQPEPPLDAVPQKTAKTTKPTKSQPKKSQPKNRKTKKK